MTKRELIEALEKSCIPDDANIQIPTCDDSGIKSGAVLRHWYKDQWILEGGWPLGTLRVTWAGGVPVPVTPK